MLADACRENCAEFWRIVGIGRDVVNSRKLTSPEGVVPRHVDEPRAQHKSNKQHDKAAPRQLRPGTRERQHGKTDRTDGNKTGNGTLTRENDHGCYREQLILKDLATDFR